MFQYHEIAELELKINERSALKRKSCNDGDGQNTKNNPEPERAHHQLTVMSNKKTSHECIQDNWNADSSQHILASETLMTACGET